MSKIGILKNYGDRAGKITPPITGTCLYEFLYQYL